MAGLLPLEFFSLLFNDFGLTYYLNSNGVSMNTPSREYEVTSNQLGTGSGRL